MVMNRVKNKAEYIYPTNQFVFQLIDRIRVPGYDCFTGSSERPAISVETLYLPTAT